MSSNFEYYPYMNLLTRIPNGDNIYTKQSLFTNELLQINNMISNDFMNSNTMLIADQVCTGTEHNSSIIIIMSLIQIFVKYQVNFITATHIHEIVKHDLI